MPLLAITKDSLAEYAKLEKLAAARDPRARTIRIDR
ncbi:hypothetical protein F4561_006060 [Lipingzhangella halophila]|uniref:Uncharacterized protein n=1 Tax=Lipingzhangella halophila TaxID=1783352 RepID=A0A7W7RND9_9ACTN|nr:hypothetical protein [Lipingzhangella halophila]